MFLSSMSLQFVTQQGQKPFGLPCSQSQRETTLKILTSFSICLCWAKIISSWLPPASLFCVELLVDTWPSSPMVFRNFDRKLKQFKSIINNEILVICSDKSKNKTNSGDFDVDNWTDIDVEIKKKQNTNLLRLCLFLSVTMEQ